MNAVEFKYDPLSYALNFEDDRSREEEREAFLLGLRDFSSRLPLSPERTEADIAIAR